MKPMRRILPMPNLPMGCSRCPHPVLGTSQEASPGSGRSVASRLSISRSQRLLLGRGMLFASIPPTNTGITHFQPAHAVAAQLQYYLGAMAKYRTILAPQDRAVTHHPGATHAIIALARFFLCLLDRVDHLAGTSTGIRRTHLLRRWHQRALFGWIQQPSYFTQSS